MKGFNHSLSDVVGVSANREETTLFIGHDQEEALNATSFLEFVNVGIDVLTGNGPCSLCSGQE